MLGAPNVNPSISSITYETYDDIKIDKELNSKKIEQFTNLNQEISKELLKIQNKNIKYEINNEFKTNESKMY